MPSTRPLKIGITCYASVGGSGVLASALGQGLAVRGHDVHFISSDRPFRLAEGKNDLMHVESPEFRGVRELYLEFDPA